MKWIEGKDYTVVLCDTTENIRFDTFYADNLEGIQLELYQFDSILSDSQRIYFLSGVNNVDKHVSVNDSENGLVVQLEGKEPQLWNTVPESTLNLIVIDNYNNNILCMKSFQYLASSFALAT